jgi:hypothetical protein
VVLYETLSQTLREEHRLGAFENRALRRTFGLKRDEVTGGWRKRHIEELRNLYSSPNDQVKKDKMGRACNTNGGEEKCMQDIDGKARRKETTRKTKT